MEVSLLEKKYIIFLGVIIFISVGLVSFSYIGMENSKANNEGKKYRLFSVEKSPALLFKGVSQSENVEEYYLESDLGEIESISVKNGQLVKKNDVIATYKNIVLQEEVGSQYDNLERLRLSLNNAKENLKNAEGKRENIKTKINNIEKEKSEIEISDKDDPQIIEFNSNIEQYQNELEIQEDIVLQAKQLLQDATIAFSVENKNIEKSKKKISQSIKSPMNGIVYIDDRGFKDSTIPFAKVVSPKTIIKGTVTEYDYENIKINTNVTVKTLNQSIETVGRIYQINELPDISEDGSVSSYSFFIDTKDNIHYGYNVQISLDLNQMKLPKEALIREADEYYVYEYSKNRVYKTKINIHQINGEYIIESGLKEKSKIIRNPDKSLKDEKEMKLDAEDE